MVGLAAGRLWANGGVEYFSNLLNWMQNASLLMLIGGLRGVVTRLTLWLALLGGSIATGKGKHINIDVVMRFLSPKMRVPVAVLGWLAAAVMCLAGSWGFVDHIAIALFHVQPFEARARAPRTRGSSKMCPTPAGEKISGEVLHDMGTDLFVIRRQLSLDVGSFPRVRRRDEVQRLPDRRRVEHVGERGGLGLALPGRAGRRVDRAGRQARGSTSLP